MTGVRKQAERDELLLEEEQEIVNKSSDVPSGSMTGEKRKNNLIAVLAKDGRSDITYARDAETPSYGRMEE